MANIKIYKKIVGKSKYKLYKKTLNVTKGKDDNGKFLEFKTVDNGENNKIIVSGKELAEQFMKVVNEKKYDITDINVSVMTSWFNMVVTNVFLGRNQEILNDLDDLLKMQGGDNLTDSYMAGLYNGLELSKSVVTGLEPKYESL